jgi:hypothetical protein
VLDLAFSDPLANAVQEEIVLKIDAPDRAVSHPHLGEAAVQVEHTDQAGPFAAPVGDRQDWSAVVPQPGQHVVAVLPDRFRHDQGGFGVDALEDVHSHALAPDKPVLQFQVVGMSAPDRDAQVRKGRHQALLHVGLGCPAGLVG